MRGILESTLQGLNFSCGGLFLKGLVLLNLLFALVHRPLQVIIQYKDLFLLYSI